jgi:hypothetical protein
MWARLHTPDYHRGLEPRIQASAVEPLWKPKARPVAPLACVCIVPVHLQAVGDGADQEGRQESRGHGHHLQRPSKCGVSCSLGRAVSPMQRQLKVSASGEVSSTWFEFVMRCAIIRVCVGVCVP